LGENVDGLDSHNNKNEENFMSKLELYRIKNKDGKIIVAAKLIDIWSCGAKPDDLKRTLPT